MISPAVDRPASTFSGSAAATAAARARGRLIAASFTLAISSAPRLSMPRRISSSGFGT